MSVPGSQTPIYDTSNSNETLIANIKKKNTGRIILYTALAFGGVAILAVAIVLIVLYATPKNSSSSVTSTSSSSSIIIPPCTGDVCLPPNGIVSNITIGAGKALTASLGNLLLADNTNEVNQQWGYGQIDVEGNDQGLYVLNNVQTGQGIATNGITIQLVDYDQQDVAQQWLITRLGGGFDDNFPFSFYHPASGKSLASLDGTTITLQNLDLQAPSQSWIVENVGFF
jgi:hypothetical protein